MHYCYSARLFKPLYLGQWEETLRSYKTQEVSVSNQVQNDCKAHENFSAIRLVRYALVITGVILTLMNFTGLELIDLCLLTCFHPSAYQTGTRDRPPRDMVTGVWASPVTCIHQRRLQWTSLHRNFPFMLSGIFMIDISNGVPILLIQTEFCFRDDTTPWLHTTLKFKILWTCSASGNIFFKNYACRLENSNLCFYLSQAQTNFISSFGVVHYTPQFCDFNYS